MNTFEKIIPFITRLFPLWVIVFSLTAFFFPPLFAPYKGWITYLLGIIMLGMGLTMSLNDFKLVLSRPKDVFYGIVLRYLIMPVVALLVTKILNLPPALAAGVILVGCCPSGTASNVMTFLAKGDTALSVTVSSFNTVLAPFVTPYIFLLLAGSIIPINAEALLLDILKIVLVPVMLGIALRALAGSIVDKFIKLVPLVSVGAIVFVISIVIALSAAKLVTVALIAFVAVALHNGLGLGLGYGASRAVGMNFHKSKAICFEIGMENSGLAVALAMAHLDPIAAIPGAIFSVWHNLTGSLLAGYWGAKSDKKTDVEVAG
ncbi:MAG: Bile acid:sodium symporter [Firmicutes bacterium]|nr:Bile acid:sodium symporter [Bacillota bacterium]